MHEAMVTVDHDLEAHPGRGVERRPVELELLLGERQPVHVALAVELRLAAVRDEPADRRAVADQLLLTELRPPEPRPPAGPRLAPVVLDEMPEQPARLDLNRAREEPVAQSGPLEVALDRHLRRRSLLGWQPPLDLRGFDLAEPPVQTHRRAAVLLVVPLHLDEQLVVAGLRPRLERDHGLVATGNLGGALEPVHLLHLLDRVALHRRPQGLLDDPVEVDEHLLAQEPVDLLLAQPVLAHQPGQRRPLVVGVVVDVHPREPAPPRDHPVDKPGERPALPLAIAPPLRPVHHLARLRAAAPAEEELEPPRRLEERMPLHVEPHVADVGCRQQPEATVGLVRQQLEDPLPRPPMVQLQRSLPLQPRERVGPDLPHLPRVDGTIAKRLERRDTRGDQLLRPRPPHPRNQRRMIVLLQPRPAQVPEVAEAAVGVRPPVRLRLLAERLEEPPRIRR